MAGRSGCSSCGGSRRRESELYEVIQADGVKVPNLSFTQARLQVRRKGGRYRVMPKATTATPKTDPVKTATTRESSPPVTTS